MALKTTFREILPALVRFVAADLRAGQDVQGQKILYRQAIVTGPGDEPGTVDLLILDHLRSNTEAFSGERNNVKLVHTAHLEDWSHGREYACVELLPPLGEGVELATSIPTPPPKQTFRERVNEDLEDKAAPTPAPTAPTTPKPPAPPPSRPAAAGGGKAGKASGKPARPLPSDVAPLDFKVPDGGGVTRSRDRLEPTRGTGAPRKPAATA